MLFDSHAHYDDEAFDGEREEVLRAVREDGVQYIVNAGSGIKESQMSVELAQKYDYIYAAVGVHPENADEFDSNSIETLRNLTGNKKVVAVGEIGLDYYYEGAQKDTQKRVFEEQLNLAMELKLPVIIHSREAHEDTYDILKPYALKGLRGVLHCYSGSVEMAREYVKLGFYIGFTGVITFKNAKKAVEVLKDIPIERVLIETDCPYLAPVPFRGKRNDSRFLKYTAHKACDVLEMEYEDFTGRTLNNARELFNIQNM